MPGSPKKPKQAISVPSFESNLTAAPATNASSELPDSPAEKMLFDNLLAIKTMLLKFHAKNMSHEMSSFNAHVDARAVEAVKHDVSLLITNLVLLRGPSPHHRLEAYGELSRRMNMEVDVLLFSDERMAFRQLTSDYKEQQVQSQQTTIRLAQENAQQAQCLSQLALEKDQLASQLPPLESQVITLTRELDKIHKDKVDTHRQAVELRMQGLDFKAEINQRCKKVLSSISSRLGFVPTGIQKQLMLLTLLKAPGDPQYDTVRIRIAEDQVRNEESMCTKESTPINDGHVFVKAIQLAYPAKTTSTESTYSGTQSDPLTSCIGPGSSAGISTRSSEPCSTSTCSQEFSDCTMQSNYFGYDSADDEIVELESSGLSVNGLKMKVKQPNPNRRFSRSGAGANDHSSNNSSTNHSSGKPRIKGDAKAKIAMSSGRSSGDKRKKKSPSSIASSPTATTSIASARTGIAAACIRSQSSSMLSNSRTHNTTPNSNNRDLVSQTGKHPSFIPTRSPPKQKPITSHQPQGARPLNNRQDYPVSNVVIGAPRAMSS